MEKLAVAVPTYNRFEMVKECLAWVLNDQRVSEIVIVDDCSTDGSDEVLEEWVAESNSPKISFGRNERNVDCYENKYRAVLNCVSPWVILFDSDNHLETGYLNALFDLATWDPDTVYCPTFAKPHFDYRKFEGLEVDAHTVRPYLEDQTFLTALNTANYMVPRVRYIQAWDESVDPHTADSLYMAYRFLKQGMKLSFVPNLHYFHRVHDGSHYKNNVHKTGNFAEQVVRKLKALK